MTGSRPPGKAPLCYRARESKRAKRVLLRVLPEGTLEVVVPPGFNTERIPAIISRHEDWIQRTRTRLEARQRLPGDELLPRVIDLRAVGRCVLLQVVPAGAGRLILSSASATRIRIEGDSDDVEGCRALLRKWLRHQARSLLIPWLHQTSIGLGLHYGLAQVRSQRTRWASCSARGTISLNERLLFLPPDLVHYVFVHELCHTVHLSHSDAFWAMLRRFEPDCDALTEAMRQAHRFIPPWIS